MKDLYVSERQGVAMAAEDRRHRYYYSPGSEAMDLSAVPRIDYPPEEKPRKVPRKQPRRAKRKNLVYLAAMVAVTGIIFVFCVQYLTIRGKMAGMSGDVAAMQEELDELTIMNDELEAEINTNIDYNKIYDKATGDYGMVYPSKGQIRTYNAEGEGYIRKYQDIP